MLLLSRFSNPIKLIFLLLFSSLTFHSYESAGANISSAPEFIDLTEYSEASSALVFEENVHDKLTNLIYLAGAGTFAFLMCKTAPYGRHNSMNWNLQIPNKLAWILMEAPSVLAFAGVFLAGQSCNHLAPQFLAGLWLTHYTYRTFIFPFLLKTRGKTMPLSIVASGFIYNTLNSYVNARSLTEFAEYPEKWLGDPRFLLGTSLFVVGIGINIHSDQILINLRKPGDTKYYIPKGGAFKWVSSANYMGEIMEWLGFAIASWSKAGLSFAFYTGSNLIPRALKNHQWYKEKFSDYPEERKAIIPKVL